MEYNINGKIFNTGDRVVNETYGKGTVSTPEEVRKINDGISGNVERFVYVIFDVGFADGREPDSIKIIKKGEQNEEQNEESIS